MINREIVYERNVTGCFMRIAAPVEAGVDERFLLRRAFCLLRRLM